MRSKKKNLFCSIKLLNIVYKYYLGRLSVIKTWSRNSVILPRFVGLIFYVHNGRKHLPVTVTNEMIGHKLGEFIFTRKFLKHSRSIKDDKIKGKFKKN